MKFPPRNQPLESEPNIRMIQEQLEKALGEIESLRLWKESASSKMGAAAGDASNTNVQVDKNTKDIIELWGREGVPQGGWRGSPLVRDVDNKLTWATPIGSIVPEYFVELEDGAGAYYVQPFGGATTDEDAKKLLPALLIEDDGRSLNYSPAWGNEFASFPGSGLLANNMPLSLTVSVMPHFDGEAFTITLPSSFRGAPWYIVNVYNNSDTYAASIETLFLDEVPFYADTGVTVPQIRSLAAFESLAWKVDADSGFGVASVQPFTTTETVDYPTDARVVTIPTDQYYWANVVGVRESETLSVFGELETVDASASPPITHGRADSQRVGKIRATITPTHTGDDILIDVTLSGVSILSTPLAIPAGTSTVTVVPDAPNFSTTWFGSAAVWLSDAPLKVLITQVGTTTADTKLTVQIFRG